MRASSRASSVSKTGTPERRPTASSSVVAAMCDEYHVRVGSRMARSLAVAIVTLLVLAPAALAKRRSLISSPLLWATVNVCDTPANPDTIGIRGSIPGSGRSGEQMYIRFRVQYYSRSENRWHNITRGADSGWVAVGSARFKVRQAGWSFRFVPPGDGTSHFLRGVAAFEWRRGDKVVNHAQERTTGRHRSATGADPAGYSAPNCEIRAEENTGTTGPTT